MNFDEIGSGCVIRYPYLWVRQADAGETGGRKDRPVAVGVRIVRARGGDGLILFAITSQTPDTGSLAVEVPETERRRAGLDGGVRLWIILDEYNQDVVGRSFYLEPGAVLGRFSRAFFLPVLKRFAAYRRQARGIDRRG